MLAGDLTYRFLRFARSGLSLLYPRIALSLPAVLVLPGDIICPDCIRSQGLCTREGCRNAVLPRLAQPTGLLRLMGEAMVEQKERQEPEPAEKVQIARIGRRNARKVARSQRRGMHGLLRAIAAAK